MRILLILLLAASIASAEFLIERVDVTVSDIQGDGSAQVHESIKVVMFGNYSSSLYDSGMSKNDLSFWSTNLGLKDAKLHINPSTVDIRDLRVRPQPRTKCNPIQMICHGELVLDYRAYPSYKDNQSYELVPGTGIFSVYDYKPRTKRFTINPAALSFTTTSEGNVILDKDVYLMIKPPADSVLLDINPRPEGIDVELPAHISSLSWTDVVLVKFSLIFDVEEGIDKEVSDFFGGIVGGISAAVSGPQGIALVALVVLVVGSYLYIMMAKRRGEE
jgi:hypothetical protein